MGTLHYGEHQPFAPVMHDAPNLIDEALVEVHQLKKDFGQHFAALESKLNRMKK
jgi:hypothetical protein